jgi:hypothetical protein
MASTGAAGPVTPSVLSQGVVTFDLSTIINQIVGLVSQHSTPSVANLLSYGVEVMQLIENVPQLTGPQKLQVLLAVINTIISGSTLSAPEQSALMSLASFLLPSFASIVCAAASGVYNINKKIEEGCSSCWGKC